MEEQRPLIGVAACILKRFYTKPHILMHLRKGDHVPNVWAVPGGHLEYHETVVEAARREVAEETGVHMSTKIRGEHFAFKNNILHQKHYVTLYVLFNALDSDFPVAPENTEPDKSAGFVWFPLDFHWDTINLFPGMEEVVTTLNHKYGDQREDN